VTGQVAQVCYNRNDWKVLPVNEKITHTHHLLPKHMGGTDDESNLVHDVEITRHAMFHFANWQLWRKHEDWVAWRGLVRFMSTEECALEAMKLGQSRGGKIGGLKGGKNQPREVKVANMMKTREKLTPEALARGGKNGPPGKHRRAGKLGGEKVARPTKVTRLSDGETKNFASIQEAANWAGVSAAGLSNVIAGRRRQCRGFVAEHLK